MLAFPDVCVSRASIVRVSSPTPPIPSRNPGATSRNSNPPKKQRIKSISHVQVSNPTPVPPQTNQPHREPALQARTPTTPHSLDPARTFPSTERAEWRLTAEKSHASACERTASYPAETTHRRSSLEVPFRSGDVEKVPPPRCATCAAPRGGLSSRGWVGFETS